MISISETIGSFNSSMVRLGGTDLNDLIQAGSMFQFQYGSIGRLDLYKIPIAQNSFNSNMVRLGVDI